MNPLAWLRTLHASLVLAHEQTRLAGSLAADLASASADALKIASAPSWSRVWCTLEGEQHARQPRQVWGAAPPIPDDSEVRVTRFMESQAAWVRPGGSYTFRFINQYSGRRLQLAVSNAEIESLMVGAEIVSRSQADGACSWWLGSPAHPWALAVQVSVQLRLPAEPQS